ncbi:MAG: enoyl-CoA hydratase/isomerase family protein [Bacteroidales bacterium]|nr:enoyl-CoA hydratase/isomerase family protein [Bacteroidales bacterium]
MNYHTIKVEFEGKLGIVTMSRPQALNALNSIFFDEFNHFLDSVEKDNNLRVIILTGEGKAFVAGADIAEMSNKNQQEGYQFGKKGQDTFTRLENMPIIFIAAVNGYALGGGCELAMACDFRIASTEAKFGQPEVNLGLTPGYAGTQRLPRLVGLGNALYLLLTADNISAQEAYRIGLVQKLVEPSNLLEESKAIANKILSKGPNAIKQVKWATRKGFNTNFAEGCEIELKAFSSLFENEGTEGMKAFLEKRKPNW